MSVEPAQIFRMLIWLAVWNDSIGSGAGPLLIDAPVQLVEDFYHPVSLAHESCPCFTQIEIVCLFFWKAHHGFHSFIYEAFARVQWGFATA